MEDYNNNTLASPTLEGEEQEGGGIKFKEIYALLVLNWKWFVLSLFVCLACAFVYLRYTTPIYQVTARMLIKDEGNKRRSSSSIANMEDFGFISNSNGVDNEIELLKSLTLGRKAVMDLKLYTKYWKEGRVKKQLLYGNQPINIDLDPMSLELMDETGLPVTMNVRQEGKAYLVEGMAYRADRRTGMAVEAPFTATVNVLPYSFRTAAGTITITKNVGRRVENFLKERTMEVNIVPPRSVAAGYIGSLGVAPASKTTSIILFTLNDADGKRASDFLQQLVVCYNQQANADKNEVAQKTEAFINERLEKINAELGATEGELESYKRSNQLVQLKTDATTATSQVQEYSKKLSDINLQIELLDYLREYVEDPKNKYQIIPSNIGLQDGGTASLISEYNTNAIDRNRLLRSASELSPQVQTLTATLDEMRRSIGVALKQARRSMDMQRQEIERQYGIFQSKVSSTPQQERILTQIGRQQEVKSGLYLMLLQKREENSISLAATADKGRLIDSPQMMGKVSPNNNMILLVAIVVGIGLPLGILILLQLLKYRIEGHDDVAKLTKLPIVADIAMASEEAKTAAGIVVHENKNDQTDEMFRSLRTNIQFMLKDDEKVILFTSTTSGEGKTFNAANLAVSFALLGKKVILVGLDIRKPALGKLFDVTDRESGITQLLTKHELKLSDIKSQVMPSGVNPNLDLLLAGPTPPNPTELLARESLGKVIGFLRNEYDYVILDTAPVGLVTDTLLLAKYTDVSVYVCRADYTPKSSFQMVNGLAQEKKLTNTCVVLNGVDMSKKKYGYYYGYGRYGKYGRYGHYGKYGHYGHYGSYGAYGNSHYGNDKDTSIKR